MTTYVETPRDVKVRSFLEHHRGLQQFGQQDDDEVWGGRTACTHTCWQLVTLLWTGKRLTLNQVNRRAGMPRNATGSTGRPRGMRISDQLRFVRAMDLPYIYKAGLSMDRIEELAKRGPIVYGTRYGSQPSWKGRRGAEPPYARKYGRTQFTGADNIRHAVLLGIVREVTSASGQTIRTEYLRRDPNHGSPARPERPPYDIINPRQARREYHDIQKVDGSLFAFVPRKGANL